MKRHDYEHAIRIIDRDPLLSPGGMLGWRARAKAGIGNFDGAMQDIALEVTANPDWRGNILDRADIHLAAGDAAAAVADLEQVMRTDPNDDAAYIRRARIREKQGDINGALADLLMAKKLEPGDRTYFDDLAVVQAKAQGREPPADAVARRLGPTPLPQSLTEKKVSDIIGL